MKIQEPEKWKLVESIVEHIPDMIFVKDAEHLRLVRFNRAGEELLGIPREEMYGKNDYDFFPEEEADFFTKKDREVLAGDQPVDISRSHSTPSTVFDGCILAKCPSLAMMAKCSICWVFPRTSRTREIRKKRL